VKIRQWLITLLMVGSFTVPHADDPVDLEVIHRIKDDASNRSAVMDSSALPGPVQPEASPMPPDNRFWFYERERIPPTTPDSGQQDPDHPIPRLQPWTLGGPLKDHDRVTQREVLQDQGMAVLNASRRPSGIMDIMLAMVDRPEHKFNVDKADGVSRRDRCRLAAIFYLDHWAGA